MTIHNIALSDDSLKPVAEEFVRKKWDINGEIRGR